MAKIPPDPERVLRLRDGEEELSGLQTPAALRREVADARLRALVFALGGVKRQEPGMAAPDDDRLLAYLLGELDTKEASTLERSLRGDVSALATILMLRQALEFSPGAAPDPTLLLPPLPDRVALGSATVLLRPYAILFTFIPPTELPARASEAPTADEIEAMLSARMYRRALDSLAESPPLREPNLDALRSEIQDLSARMERIERTLRGIKDPSLFKALPAARSALLGFEQFLERRSLDDWMRSGGRPPAYLVRRGPSPVEEPAWQKSAEPTTRLAVPAGTEQLLLTGEPGREPRLMVHVTGQGDEPVSSADLSLVRPGRGFDDAQTDLGGRASFGLSPGRAVLQMQGSQVRELQLQVAAD